MNTLLKTSAIAIVLTGAFLGLANTASANPNDRNQTSIGVSLNFGDVAIGYRDGYWDHRHGWHNWNHRRDAVRYRESRRGEYHHWNHTRDRDQGWHDSNQADHQSWRGNDGDRRQHYYDQR